MNMNKLKTDDLDAPWFVIEETDNVFSENTNREICYQSNHGPVQICLNSVQSAAYTHRRQRIAYLMAAAPMLYDALWELYQLLEQHDPSWYLQQHHNLALNALFNAQPPEKRNSAA